MYQYFLTSKLYLYQNVIFGCEILFSTYFEVLIFEIVAQFELEA